jgi:hypothetical protein
VRGSAAAAPARPRACFEPFCAPALLAQDAVLLYLACQAVRPRCWNELGRMSEIPSPCVGVCRLDPVSGLCAGCMRTLDEIASWPTADDAERLAIVLNLRVRRRAAGRTSAADSRARRRRNGGGTLPGSRLR